MGKPKNNYKKEGVILKVSNFFIIMCALIFLAGCAEMDIPTPKDIIQKPLGTDSIRRGMNKDQVRALWGEADNISYEKIEEAGTLRSREVWIYKARYSAIPVDADYLSKTKYLYFDGNSLAKISDVALGSDIK